MSGDPELSGNYGMMDMVAALWWVRRNIEFFNGDPNQVTLMGHSAGGCSVGFLVMSPLTKGSLQTIVLLVIFPVDKIDSIYVSGFPALFNLFWM